MTISVLRTAEGWWVQKARTPSGSTPPRRPRVSCWASATRCGPRFDAGATDPVDSLTLCSPVTAVPGRGPDDHFASHVRDAGMDPASTPLTFFRKSSASISGPRGPVVKPPRTSGFLDHEVEIGLGSDGTCRSAPR